jgi:hypothetical protein
MSTSAAQAVAAQVRQIPIGHLEGDIPFSCPAEDGSATVVALQYPDGRTVDLYMTTSGCTTISNGYIVNGGSVPIPSS